MKKLIILTTIILLFSCIGDETYLVKGTIIEIHNESNKFIIHHDEIPGFMMSMTMPFTLADSLDIDRFKIGDSLKFRLIISNETAFADEFELLGKGALPEIDDMRDEEYEPLDIGEVLSDVTLLNLDSTEFSLSEYDGKFRLISYIFTRCPMPNMCPAVIAKNQYLARIFKDEPNLEFILISFDYIYDTPSILKQNYGSLLEVNPNIKIFSSTEHLNDIFSLAGQSNVSFWGVNEDDIGHTLRSIFIDPDRRLMQVFDGTDWRTDAAERDIKNILRAYNF